MAGCPSGVPLLADLFRVAGRTGSAPLPPLVLVVVGASQGCGGWAPSSGPSGFRRWGPSPFRTLSGGCLSLHWQAWRDRGAETWVVEVLRLGYCLPFLGIPPLPLFPSQCLLPAPSPSRGLLWRRSPWASLPWVLWSLLHSLLRPSLAICS